MQFLPTAVRRCEYVKAFSSQKLQYLWKKCCTSSGHSIFRINLIQQYRQEAGWSKFKLMCKAYRSSHALPASASGVALRLAGFVGIGLAPNKWLFLVGQGSQPTADGWGSVGTSLGAVHCDTLSSNSSQRQRQRPIFLRCLTKLRKTWWEGIMDAWTCTCSDDGPISYRNLIPGHRREFHKIVKEGPYIYIYIDR